MFLEKGRLVGGKMWERNGISGMVWFHGLVCNKLDQVVCICLLYCGSHYGTLGKHSLKLLIEHLGTF